MPGAGRGTRTPKTLRSADFKCADDRLLTSAAVPRTTGIVKVLSLNVQLRMRRSAAVAVKTAVIQTPNRRRHFLPTAVFLTFQPPQIQPRIRQGFWPSRLSGSLKAHFAIIPAFIELETTAMGDKSPKNTDKAKKQKKEKKAVAAAKPAPKH